MTLASEKETQKTVVTPLLKDTYLAVIHNSIGSRTFRNSYARIDGKKTDILEDGALSCAFFVSSILLMFGFFGLIKEIHATVDSTVRDLLSSGWKVVSEPRVGAIIVWGATDAGEGRGMHKHIGFYVGDQKAISNSDKVGTPALHDLTFDSKRSIEKILWHPLLD